MKNHAKLLYGAARARKKHSGFTLLEVLIALIFFSLIGMVLQQVTASTVSQYLSVRQKMFASWMAENKLAELRLAKAMPAAREYKEDLDYANEEWQIITKVKKTESSDINKVEVEVYHTNSNTDEKRRKLVLTGFIGRF